jgi:hypothetical protein
MALDTLKVAKRLREAGFSEPQAEAVVAVVQDATGDAELATKRDLTDLATELRTELHTVHAALQREMREMELRLEAKIEAMGIKIEAMGATIMNRVFGLILGAILVNIVTVVGALFAVAKLVGR